MTRYKGDYEQARDYFERTYEKRKMIFDGEAHSDMAECYNVLGITY